MSTGKTIGYIVAGILIFAGAFLFLAGFSAEYGDPVWKVYGGVAVLIGLGLIVVLARIRVPQGPQEIVQKIDLSGQVSMEKLKCKNCGADLDKESITVKEGAILVSCPYCGSTYQVVEEPKW